MARGLDTAATVDERSSQPNSRRTSDLVFPRVSIGSPRTVNSDPVSPVFPATDRPIQRTTNPNVPNPTYNQSGGIVGVNHSTKGNEINSRGALSTDPRTAGMYVPPDFYHGSSYSPVFMGPNGEYTPRFEGQVVYGPWRGSLPPDYDPNARVYHDPLYYGQGSNYWKQNPDGNWVRRETGYGGIPLNDDGTPRFTPDPIQFPEYFVSGSDDSPPASTASPRRQRTASAPGGSPASESRTSRVNSLLTSISSASDPQATATDLSALADAINNSKDPQATKNGLRAIAEAIESAPDPEAARAFWKALAAAVLEV